MGALQVVGLAIWLVLGLVGAWGVITGRKLFGLPRDIKEGWPLRIFGLAYVLAAAFFTFEAYRVSRGAPAPSFLYVVAPAGGVVVLGLVLALWSRRRRVGTATDIP